MKNLIFFALLLCAFNSKGQLQTFILENSTSTTQYDNLDSALSNAQTGDILYLPAGVISFSRYISKSITIIGTGAHPDSTIATGQTIITTSPTTIQNVNNFTITGVYFQGNLEVKNSSNLLLSRCMFGSQSTDPLEIYNTNNIKLDGCVINFLIANPVTSSANTTNLIANNCIFYGYLHAKNAVFENNIFLNQSSSSSTTFFYNSTYNYYASYCLFKNNIINNNSTSKYLSQHNTFYNNIFTDSINVATATAQNNISKKPINTIFESVNNTSVYTPSNNLHLKSGSPAISAGINNVDCGVYGGSSPFKEGMVPYNPHIQSADIASSTDQNGNLKVNIKVRSQSR